MVLSTDNDNRSYNRSEPRIIDEGPVAPSRCEYTETPGRNRARLRPGVRPEPVRVGRRAAAPMALRRLASHVAGHVLPVT